MSSCWTGDRTPGFAGSPDNRTPTGVQSVLCPSIHPKKRCFQSLIKRTRLAGLRSPKEVRLLGEKVEHSSNIRRRDSSESRNNSSHGVNPKGHNRKELPLLAVGGRSPRRDYLTRRDRRQQKTSTPRFRPRLIGRSGIPEPPQL